MSIKTVFEKIGEDIEAVFKKLFSVTWENKALTAIEYSEPFLEGIITLADPAIAPMVNTVITDVINDLTAVKTVVSQGTVVPNSSDATKIEAALISVNSNLAALLADADVKNSTKASQIEAAVNIVVGEVTAILGEVPVTPSASAAS